MFRTSQDLVIAVVLFGGIYSLILIAIICAGVMPKRRDKIQMQNQQLLALMAEKVGVEISRINKIVVENKGY